MDGRSLSRCAPSTSHFTEWLDDQKIKNAAVFHFGTGTHHHVGITCAQNGSNNSVFGITASVQEIEAYTKLAIENPKVSRSYKAIFGDIYLLDGKLLPEFDVVSLFHLCEFWGPESAAYNAMTDRQMLDLMTQKTKKGGHILFYTKSMAFDRAEKVIAEWAKEMPVEKAGEFKTLLVYRKK
jgi:hypothetical protein